MYNEEDYKDNNNIETGTGNADGENNVDNIEEESGVYEEERNHLDKPVEEEVQENIVAEDVIIMGMNDSPPMNHSNEPANNNGNDNNEVKEEIYPYREPVRNDIPVVTVKRKKSGIWKKALGLTAAGLLFGLVSGGTMVGVDMLGDYLRPGSTPQIGTVETIPGITTSTTNNNMDVSQVSEGAMPSIVAITNTMVYQNNWFFGETQSYEVPSSGSGIIVGQNDEELLIVTNNHVIENSESLKVTFIDKTTVDAAVKGTDSESDLAVIAVPIKSLTTETQSAIKVARMGNSDDLKVGQGVIAIGNALGYGQSLTVGYVSALNRQVSTDAEGTTSTYIQTDAAINPGNSGGALLNMNGEVIGINAAKLATTEVEGIGYAIPISYAQDIISELMNKTTKIAVGTEEEGFLGFQGQNIDNQTTTALGIPQGVYVYKILEDSPAANSDLREKDIITKFDDEKVSVMADIQKLLTYYSGGTTVTLTVHSVENGQYVERKVDVTLGYKKDNNQQ